MTTPQPRSSRWANPRYIVPTVLLLSLGLLAGAWLAGWQINGAELLYDLSVGVGVATALSMVVSVYFRRLERGELERERQEQARWDEIQDRVRGLQEQSQQLEQFIGFTDVQRLLDRQAMVLAELQDELQWVRTRVDPTYRHPTEVLVDECLRVGDEVVAEAPAARPPDTVPEGFPRANVVLRGLQDLLVSFRDRLRTRAPLPADGRHGCVAQTSKHDVQHGHGGGVGHLVGPPV